MFYKNKSISEESNKVQSIFLYIILSCCLYLCRDCTSKAIVSWTQTARLTSVDVTDHKTAAFKLFTSVTYVGYSALHHPHADGEMPGVYRRRNSRRLLLVRGVRRKREVRRETPQTSFDQNSLEVRLGSVEPANEIHLRW